jgi:potassium/hydrogen antiporter
MDIHQAIKNSPRAIVLGFTGFILNVLVTAFLCKFLLGWRLMNGLLLGSIVGGSSSIIVVALTRKLGIGGKTEIILSLNQFLPMSCAQWALSLPLTLFSRRKSVFK